MVTFTAEVAAVGTSFTAIGADVNMVATLAAGAADIAEAVCTMLFALSTNHFTV